MMGKLYPNTSLVYAWLGGDDDDGTIEDVFGYILKFSRHFRADVEKMDDFFGNFKKHLGSNSFRSACERIIEDLDTGALSIPDALWKQLGAFTRRPYWIRTWVQQELLLPPKVSLLCGRASISLRIFIAWWLTFNRYHPKQRLITGLSESAPYTSHPLYAPAIVCMVVSNRKNLVSVLAACMGCSATVSHDIVYGTLGIYEGSTSIAIDYNKPAALVFGEVVRTIAEETG